MKSIFFMLVILAISGCTSQRVLDEVTNTTDNHGALNCSFGFSVDGGRGYSQSEIRSFVVNEIRSRLSREQKKFKVHIMRQCGVVKESVDLGMDSIALYIESFNGVVLDGDVLSYTNDNISLDRASYQAAFTDATKFSQISKKQQQDTLKRFAFLIAESARFEDIELATEQIMTTDCSYQWGDYMNLVRRWKTMSIFVNEQGLVRGLPAVGGQRAFLIAPITSSDVSAYNKASAGGWKMIMDKYGMPPRVDDKSPISIGKPVCEAGRGS